MRYIDIRPDLLGAGVLEVIERVDMEVVLGCMEGMNEWYEGKLPLWGVLRVYGEDGVCGDDENVTVSCRLPMHGGGDIHASAKYFRDDRESGKVKLDFIGGVREDVVRLSILDVPEDFFLNGMIS